MKLHSPHKGEIWDKKSIEKTVHAVIRAKQNKPLFVKWLDRNIIWLILIITILGSGFVAYGFMPLVIISSGFISYLVLGLIGLVIGVIFESLIADIEHLEHKHHLLILSVIPLSAILSFFLMINGLESRGADIRFDFILGGGIYSFFLLLPFIVHEHIIKKKKK